MGREIRKVPAGWEHPTEECKHFLHPAIAMIIGKSSEAGNGCEESRRRGDGRCYKPLSDGLDFEHRVDSAKEFDEEPPKPEWFTETRDESLCTHIQMYETVSEGTPYSPVFATEDELVDWLVKDGGYDGPLPRDAAERFVKGGGWAPSLVIQHNPDGTKEMYQGTHTALLKNK